MDEEKDLEQQDSQPANEDGDSQDTDQVSEPDKDKIIADLEEKNKQLFARVQKGKDKPEKVEEVETPPVPQVTDVDRLVAQKFEERDLISLDVSDDVRDEIKAYAKAKDISVLEASKSDYVGFLKTKEEEKSREVDASASTKGTGATAKRDFSSLADEDIRDLSDEDFDAYKGWLNDQG